MSWRTLLLCPAVLILVAGCGRPAPQPEPEPVMVPVSYDNAESAVAVGVISADGLPAGSTWVRLTGDRDAVSFGYLCDDRPVGFWTYRHGNGQVSMQGRYLYGGIQDGEWSMWYANGRPLSKGSYARGARHGEWEQWHSNGRRSTRGSYSMDQRMGLWISWWPTGKIKTRGSYVAGKPTGRWNFWDEDGTPLPNHTHSHVDETFPEQMRPPVIEWDGHRRIEQDNLAPFRPGKPAQAGE